DDIATRTSYLLSLHDALPILFSRYAARWVDVPAPDRMIPQRASEELEKRPGFGPTLFTILLPVVLMLAKALVDIVIDDTENSVQDRKSTRLNSSHVKISYAVF